MLLLLVVHAVGHAQGLHHKARASPNPAASCGSGCHRGHSRVDAEGSHGGEIDEGDVATTHLARPAVGEVEVSLGRRYHWEGHHARVKCINNCLCICP